MKKFTVMIGTLILAASIGSASAGTDNTPPKGPENAPGVVKAAKNSGDVEKKQAETANQKGKQCDGPQNQNKVRTER